MAQFSYKYKKYHLGMFETEEEAAVAFNEGAKRYYYLIFILIFIRTMTISVGVS